VVWAAIRDDSRKPTRIGPSNFYKGNESIVFGVLLL